jgi:hypothetical protein
MRVEILEFENPETSYWSLMKTGLGSPGKRPLELRFTFPGAEIDIHNAGFTPRRWVKYCDFYLKGGPVFEEFLKRKGTYSFVNAAGHKKGACLNSVSIERSCVIVKSRACLFAPTGILDFKLMSIIMKRLNLPLIWHIDEINFSLDFMGCLSHRVSKNQYPTFWERFRHNTVSSFLRHRRMTKLHRTRNESEIKNHLVFLTLRDLSWMYGEEKNRKSVV